MEGIIAIILIFGFIPLMVYKAVRERARIRESSGDALRRSELDQMIQESVEDALEPYRQRIETLEAIATDPDEKLEGRVDPTLLLDDPEELETHEADSQRTRA